MLSDAPQFSFFFFQNTYTHTAEYRACTVTQNHLQSGKTSPRRLVIVRLFSSHIHLIVGNPSNTQPALINIFVSAIITIQCAVFKNTNDIIQASFCSTKQRQIFWDPAS